MRILRPFRADTGMRFRNLLLWDIRFQAKYGFYLLYSILTCFYAVLMISFPALLFGTFLASVLFTLMGLIVAIKTTSLNQFLLAAVPYFVPAPYSFGLSFLPSFWMGMAARKDSLVFILLSVVVSLVWIVNCSYCLKNTKRCR